MRADIPREVERVVLRAMARRPEDRYASAADLRAALLAAQHRVGGPTDPTVAEPTSPGAELSFVRSERSWLVPTALVVAVAAVLVAAGLIVGGTSAGQDFVDRFTSALGAGSDSDDPSATTVAQPVGPLTVNRVTDVDPDGDGQEHPNELANIVDGDAATTWSTEGYFQDFVQQGKSGVGLAFDLGQARPLRTMEVVSPTAGWTAEIYVSDQAPSTAGPEAWGPSVGRVQSAGPHRHHPATRGYERSRRAAVDHGPGPGAGRYAPGRDLRRHDHRVSPAEGTRSAHARLAQLADEDLAGRAAEGDRAALDVLLRRHQQLVYRLCRRMCAGEADALDATQEALVTVARRIDRFDGRASFTTWLYRVTTNACLDELRRRRRRPQPIGTDPPGAAGASRMGRAGGGATHTGASGPSPLRHHPSPDDPADVATQRVDLERAMGDLTPAARAVVVLRDQLGMDYAEIATVLEVPTGTVKSRLARARAQLMAALDAHSPAGAGNQPSPSRRPTPNETTAARATLDLPSSSPASPAGPLAPPPP